MFFKRKKNNFFIFLLLIIVFILLFPSMKKNVLKIVVIVHKPEGFHNAFWDALQMGARKAAKEKGAELFYAGIPLEYGDKRVEGQTAVFEKFINMGVKGIVFTPCDRIGMVRAVKNAVLKGVKVVAIDSPIESNLPETVIATNNYEAGLIAAKHMIKLLSGKGKVVLMRHPAKDNKATRDRELAFIDGLKIFAPDIKIVSTEEYGGATLETDYPSAKRILNKYKDLDGVYAISGTGTVAFVRAIDELKLSGKIKLIGWDASPEALEGLKKGIASAIVQQNPERMGYEGVFAVISAINGEKIKKKIDTGVTLVTLDNIDTPEVKKLIYPDFTGWIK